MEEPTSLCSSFEYPDWHYDEKQSAYWYYDINTNAYHLYVEGLETAPLNSTKSEDAFPLWYYDRGRSLYWYFCKDLNAYYMYEGYHGAQASQLDSGGEFHGPVGLPDSEGLIEQHNCGSRAVTTIQSQDHDSYCRAHIQAHEISNQVDGNGKISCDDTSTNSMAAHFPPSSSAPEKLFSPAAEGVPPLASGWVEDFLIESFLNGYSDLHAGADLSSADTSSDLDCHLSQSLAGQMDVNNDSTHCGPKDLDDKTIDSNRREETNEKASSSIILFDEDLDVTNLVQEVENKRLKCDSNVEGLKNEERDAELWLAQYGQVTRTDAETKLRLGALSLWNWRKAVRKGKGRQKSSIYLVGQVAATISKLHPSLQQGSGFIKTSCICAVNRDLVKVSSGRLYRLRLPSSKHIRSVAIYDSSDPTKDWDFPCIPSSVSEHFENESKSSHDSLIAKPFVPYMNHHRYHDVSTKQKRSSVQEDLRLWTIRGFTATDQRHMYRDRAKERRDLYGGYGGLDQRMLDNDELESDKTFIESASQSEIIPMVKPVAKRLLERMGWTEGESLGKHKDGIKEPLQGMGNIGRAGIGWTSASH